ncbi:MAG TPA: O-methyltransferase, partial [Nitrososphaera sp.]|nr:O-methyltransferase [Nitrososphaera sp.]
MDSRVLRVISRLDRQSIIERNGKARIAPGQEMLAITADTGVFFSILLKGIKGKRVLEIGTSAGFSTLWFADAVGKKGKIITIEEDPLKVERARDNFRQAGVDKLIVIKRGVALDVLRTVKGKFDFVLLDADKENIIKYFDLVLPLVRAGGIIAADNMLFPPHYRPMMKKYARHVRSKRDV